MPSFIAPAPSPQMRERVGIGMHALGSSFFVAGSVCFFPLLASWQTAGNWLFCAGSVCFLLLNGYALLSLARSWRDDGPHGFGDRINLTSAIAYTVAALVFVAGRLFFVRGNGTGQAAGALLSVAGSVLFVLAGLINIIQVVEWTNLLAMQLFNLTVAFFLLGSALFAVASVPWLWSLDGATRLQTLTAAQFLVASVAFLLGSGCIYLRKLVRDRLNGAGPASRFGHWLLGRWLQAEIDERSPLAQAQAPRGRAPESR